MRVHKFRAWDKQNNEMVNVEALATNILKIENAEWENLEDFEVMEYTGLPDENGIEICEGDITKLVLEDGEIRFFEVAIRTVTRELVSHPGFDEPTARIRIRGVVFLWQGFELFPCVDENGIPDNERMEIVGNIHDNPELLIV